MTTSYVVEDAKYLCVTLRHFPFCDLLGCFQLILQCLRDLMIFFKTNFAQLSPNQTIG